MEQPMALGFRFCPTDEEIIVGYLLKKVTNQSMPSKAVLECDLYGDENSWQNKLVEGGEKCLYFFTNLKKKKTENGSRIDRVTVSGGKWKAQKDEKILYNGQLHVGSKTSFSYVTKQWSRAQYRWTMTEYRLDGCLLVNICDKDDNYVLCQIKKWKNKGPTRKESDSFSLALTQDVNGTGESSMDTSASLNFERDGIAQKKQVLYGSNVVRDDFGHLFCPCPLTNASSSQQPIVLSPPIDASTCTVMESGFGIQEQLDSEAHGSSVDSPN